MKKIIIPIPKEDSITISEINSEGKYLILCYKQGKPVGYIFHTSYDDILWVFSNLCDIDTQCDINISDYSLLNCVNEGIKRRIFDELKLIEFE